MKEPFWFCSSDASCCGSSVIHSSSPDGRNSFIQCNEKNLHIPMLNDIRLNSFVHSEVDDATAVLIVVILLFIIPDTPRFWCFRPANGIAVKLYENDFD